MANEISDLNVTNNLEIKMCIVRNMHRLLDKSVKTKVREKFAAYYTHIESESKGNWRVRFSILTSLIGNF